ncbi:MAG TPA: cupredoxin family copper-binding protein [Amycolatopsis sp.]|nr:cupredoxin family copper-binding protein [Amycolatopsis sp.]
MDMPDPAPDRKRRSWPLAVAILALATALLSLATLRGGQAEQAAPSRTADVDLAALAKQSQLAVPLYQGLASEQAAPAQAKTVDAMGYKFTPANLTIAVGDTVTWTNHDSAPHNIVITDGPEKFTSPTLQTGQSFSHTFTLAGNYAYYCSIHPDMKATITVTGTATTAPTTPVTTAPTTAPTHTMPSSPPPGGGSCVPKAALQPIFDHIKAAHLERSPAEQVQDILNFDQYLKTHTVWLETVLAPAFDGSGSKVVADTLQPIIDHIKTAHLERSLTEQVSDLLNLDQYIKTHTVWLETVLTPLLNQATC